MLARELRQHGFPQEPRQESVANPDDPTDIAAVPTLISLVDACGEHLRGIIHGGDTWFAVGWGMNGEGDNVTDAVARLWMKIDYDLDKPPLRPPRPPQLRVMK